MAVSRVRENMASMRRELAYSFRTLRRSPLFTTAAVLSLALGIGANTAIFSLLNQVVLRSLPVRDPERLVVLHTDYSGPGLNSSDNSESVFSYPMYRDLRDRDTAFSGVIARMGTPATIGWQGNTESAAAELVSGNFFRTLGVGAALGRVLTPEDDGAPGGGAVVVLSHSFWSAHFANDPAILNQTVTINGHPMVVAGVADARFNGIVPGNECDLFVPIAMQRELITTMDALKNRRIHWLNVFARLKPDVTVAQAQAATDVVYHAAVQGELAEIGRMRSDHDRDEFLNHRAQLRPAAQGISELRDRFEKPLVALMTLVGLVLLIACGNVASLLLARATGRQREIAIRLAMGASRWSLTRQLITEGLVLSLLGGAVGMIAAAWGTSILLDVLPKDFQNWLTSAIDLRLLAFNFGAASLCGLLFGLIPALQTTRPNLVTTLKSQAGSIASGSGTARLRKVLVAGQLMLSLVLVAGAGLFTASLVNMLNLNLGYRTQRLIAFSVNATLTRPKAPESIAFYRDLEQRLAALPGVTGVAAAAAGGPFSGSNRGGNITVEGYDAKPDEYTGSMQIGVSAGYFRRMGIPLRAGREFTDHDGAAAPKVVVVNETFVKRYFGGRNAVGRRLMFGSSNHPKFDLEIVGVAADQRTDMRKPPKETIYFPYPQDMQASPATYYVRYAGEVGPVASAIRAAVRSADSKIPVPETKTVELRIREALYTERLIAVLSNGFGLLATLLAAVGLYGVVAFAVTQRTSEIGIRMALGALPGDVLRLILKEAGVVALTGIGAGLAGAAVLSRLLETQLFGISPADPVILCGSAGVLVIVALIAALLPGWRAARIDPVRALKYE
jgi:predicted permease